MPADHGDELYSSSSCLIFDNSVGLPAGIQSAGVLVSGTLGSNTAFSRGRQLVSFWIQHRKIQRHTTYTTKRRAHTFHHKNNYKTMQSNLEAALESINRNICIVKHENNMSTPYCLTVIRKRIGMYPQYYYNDVYDLLWDWQYGTDTTKDKWADAIQRTIWGYRGKALDTEDELNSIGKALVEEGKNGTVIVVTLISWTPYHALSWVGWWWCKG